MLPSWKELGASGSIGLLVGIGLTIWLAPTTAAGTGVIIVASVAFWLAIGTAVGALWSARRGKGS